MVEGIASIRSDPFIIPVLSNLDTNPFQNILMVVNMLALNQLLIPANQNLKPMPKVDG